MANSFTRSSQREFCLWSEKVLEMFIKLNHMFELLENKNHRVGRLGSKKKIVSYRRYMRPGGHCGAGRYYRSPEGAPAAVKVY